jgi:hypothetical protein
MDAIDLPSSELPSSSATSSLEPGADERREPHSLAPPPLSLSNPSIITSPGEPLAGREPKPFSVSSQTLPHSDVPTSQFPPSGDVASSGWDYELKLFFLHSLVDLGWGIALLIFAQGVVPYSWTLSQYAKQKTTATSFVLTLAATASTTHVQYVYSQMIDLYARAKVADGFTRSDWRWMQGVKEWSLFTPFPRLRTTVGWALVWGAMELHSASIVAILQPVDLVKNYEFNDSIPCPVDSTQLAFDVPDKDPVAQANFDRVAATIGGQWPTYYDAVGGNTTTAVLGRTYVKEDIAYGVVGGLVNGLQEIPGVRFNTNCDEEHSSWPIPFAGLSPSSIPTANGNVSIVAPPIANSSIYSVSAHTSDAFKGVQAAFYGVVSITGSGAFVVADAEGNITSCTWTTIPLTVTVQNVAFVSGVLSTSNSTQWPQNIGRAVRNTVQGIADVVASGVNLPYQYPWYEPWEVVPVPSMTKVLQIILADGAKAYLTGFVSWYAGDSTCHSNNRTVQVHWKCGNEYNLGWIAIIATSLTGLLGCRMALWLGRKPRLKKQPWKEAKMLPGPFKAWRQPEIGPLDLDCAFKFGLHSKADAIVYHRRYIDFEQWFDENLTLQVWDGAVVVK